MADEEPSPNGANLAYIEGLFEEYLENPESVPEEWARYFQRFDGNGGLPDRIGPSFRPPSLFNPNGGNGHSNGNGNGSISARIEEMGALQHRVDMLIRNYRVRGHRMSCLDAVGRPTIDLPELDASFHQLTEADLDRTFAQWSTAWGKPMTLREIIARMQNTYCRSIGAQFMHIDEIQVRDWLQERMERTENRIALSHDEQLRILTSLTDAVIFEEFIQRKYPGAKSFSLEGAESLIPLLYLAMDKAGEHGIEEVVLGMAHRGRLNVLANFMGKAPAQIFREYEDKDPDSYTGRGDVKYHLGYHTDFKTANGHSVHLALCFNPSHLEYVNPVALGRVRSWQDRTGDTARERGMCLLIHGDAAFAGEGIVQETLNLSNLRGYATGGTLHIVVNNQIGFTTTPNDSRSTTYCTDIAKMLQSPIFHVDGEDPEAVAQVISLAMEFRKTFKRDVVIDMYCYRKRGHNEGDEPAFTQPLLYKEISERKGVRSNYLNHLTNLGEVTDAEAEEIAERRKARLEKALEKARAKPQVRPKSVLRGLWSQYKGGPDKDVEEVDTGVPRKKLAELIGRVTQVPRDFQVHPKLEKILDQRRALADGSNPLDWATAEILAIGSLAVEGAHVRITGQDSQRGTFSHRHSVLHDYKTGQEYSIFADLSPDQAAVDIYNSPLSEAGVLGFEYGYSLAYPDGLTVWEAQFGDFSNAAQVILDQFISSAEDKWRSLSGLVMLLPHGFEGMGPEHSSSRIERFLSLAAEDNFQVCNPTTPAQYFHLLRRQVHRPWRKPLIVMTPKSLLRHPRCVSPVDEFENGSFQRIIPDETGNTDVERILLCSGKIYYELEERREKEERDDLAIVRVEQLYPLQPEHVEEALAPYAKDTPVYWVQEEPENMGAWRRMKGKFGERLLGKFPFTVACRPASASPATGSAHSHRVEQETLISTAFGTEETSWY